jgi:hypothetical protein
VLEGSSSVCLAALISIGVHPSDSNITLLIGDARYLTVA